WLRGTRVLVGDIANAVISRQYGFRGWRGKAHDHIKLNKLQTAVLVLVYKPLQEVGPLARIDLENILALRAHGLREKLALIVADGELDGFCLLGDRGRDRDNGGGALRD